jgi:excisionase family DNA binding protein
MKILTVKEVAEFLRVSEGCVYSLAAQGVLPSVRIGVGRGVIRFQEEDVSAFIQNCRSPRRRREPASRPA